MIIKNPFSRPVCANCRNQYNAEDKYCRYCGAPMGSPLFIDEGYPMIYGPAPRMRMHVCKKCGYSWETHLMVVKTSWCPQCGGSAPAVEERREIFALFGKKKPAAPASDEKKCNKSKKKSKK